MARRSVKSASRHKFKLDITALFDYREVWTSDSIEKYRGGFRPDMKAWLDDNCSHRWRVVNEGMKQFILFNIKDENIATLFKLKFYESFL
jgi:hypothetical protein